MVKEAVICIIIIVSIFSLDIFTQNYTKDTVTQVTDKFEKIKQYIKNENKDQANIEMEELNKIWKNKHDILAYYIEHDELEKVDVTIKKMMSYINTEDFSEAIAELEDGKFVLEHIADKNDFNVQNVF